MTVPGPAEAVCGATHRFPPLKRVTRDRAPVAIGDSVIFGAKRQLQRVGFEVDIRGCRQMSEGLRVLRRRRRAGTLPPTVVIALGTNASIRTADIRRALRIVGRNRVLALVTPREDGGGSGSDAAVIRRAGRRWRGWVRVLDWVRYSAGQPSWFAFDGVHLGPSGAAAMARLLKRVVRLVTPRRGAWTGSAGRTPLAFSVNRRGSIREPVLITTRGCFGGSGRIELARQGLRGLRVSGTGRFRRSASRRSNRVRFAGRFTRAGRARGTLRVRAAGCDTGLLRWSTRARAPHRHAGRWNGRDSRGNRFSFYIPNDRLSVGSLGRPALRGSLPLACFPGGSVELADPIPISAGGFTTVQRMPDGSTLELNGRFLSARRAAGQWRRAYSTACTAGPYAWTAERR